MQIAGVDYLYFIQKNTLNRRDRTLRIEVHNETFSSRVIVRECCNYSVSPTTLRVFISLLLCLFYYFCKTVVDNIPTALFSAFK